MNRFIRNSGFYLILFLVVVGIVRYVSDGSEATDNPRYDQLKAALAAGNVSSVTVQFDNYAYLVTGEYKNKPADAKSNAFSSYIPATDAAINEIETASDNGGTQVVRRCSTGSACTTDSLQNPEKSSKSRL